MDSLLIIHCSKAPSDFICNVLMFLPPSLCARPLFKRFLNLRLFFAFAFFFVENVAQARVGGGEHFDSGRVSEGSGEGDSEVIAFLLRLLLEFVVREPKIGIPLLVLCGAAYWVYRKKSVVSERKWLDKFAARINTHVDAAKTQAWIALLQKEDPDFQINRLFEYSHHIFHQIQKAWFQRDLQSVRPFLSDAVFQRLRVQLKLMEKQGVRDAIADWKVLTLQLVGLEKTPVFDVVHIRVNAQIRDTEVLWKSDDAYAFNKARRAPLEDFSEVWSLLRRPGVKTRLGEEWIQGFCPHCGAPFSGGASNQCEHCEAIVNSGNYDWVLAEITQSSEYVSRSLSSEQLLEKMRQTDSELSVQVLEDKASLCFWRCLEAISSHNTTPLAKIATSDFRRHFSQQMKAYAQSPLKHCAVGGVDLIKSSENPFLNLHVLGFQIRWSAHFMGRFCSQLWLLELARKRGVKTSPRLGMATFRCPNCHAPLSDSSSTTCDYCSHLLEAGDADWVLVAVECPQTV